jgi:hypothetical protein
MTYGLFNKVACKTRVGHFKGKIFFSVNEAISDKQIATLSGLYAL